MSVVLLLVRQCFSDDVRICERRSSKHRWRAKKARSTTTATAKAYTNRATETTKKTTTTSIRTRATITTESTDSGDDTASEDATACVTDDEEDEDHVDSYEGDS